MVRYGHGLKSDAFGVLEEGIWSPNLSQPFNGKHPARKRRVLQKLICIGGHVHMTSAKIPGFWTPSLPLVSTNPRNLPSFGKKLANPLPPPQRRRHMYIAPWQKLTWNDHGQLVRVVWTRHRKFFQLSYGLCER